MATGAYNPRVKEDDRHKDEGQNKDKNKNGGAVQGNDAGQNKEVFDKAKEVGGQMVDKAKETAVSVGEMASQAATAVGKKADEFACSAGSDIKKFGDTMSEKAPHEGLLGQASQAVAEGIKGSGRYLEDAKLSGMADDVTHLIKRHPVPAVLICLSVGFMLGRCMKD